MIALNVRINMNKFIFAGFLILIPACSSFGIRTSTLIPHVDAGNNAKINIYMDGSIPGSEIEANVPIEDIILKIQTQLNELRERIEER